MKCKLESSKIKSPVSFLRLVYFGPMRPRLSVLAMCRMEWIVSSQDRALVVPLRYVLVLGDPNYLCLVDSVAECR